MSGHQRVPLTVCVLTYGNYCDLARRCIDSILANTDRALYRLVVGANAVAQETDHYLLSLQTSGAIDRVHRSRRNLNKNPMMRRMFRRIDTPYVCLFDDDSYVLEKRALQRLLERVEFIRTAKWYRGLTPPGRAPGGKGEFNFEGRGTGDPRWEFILGGFWLMRTWAIRAMDWPDRRLVNLGEDVLLGEAVRQQGWSIENAPKLGIAINQAPRRGPDGGLRANWGMKRRTESKLVQ
jgi:hypothetical protein